MKKQILQTVLGFSILPAYALSAPLLGEGFEIAFCDRYVMHSTPSYSTMCQDANSYDSHMAEFKARSWKAVMRYVWKKAKSSDRRSAFTDAYYNHYADHRYAQHLGNSESSRNQEIKSTRQDVKETTDGFFKDARYSLRVSRDKFIMKLSVKY